MVVACCRRGVHDLADARRLRKEPKDMAGCYAWSHEGLASTSGDEVRKVR